MLFVVLVEANDTTRDCVGTSFVLMHKLQISAKAS
jgi:hypothetical protein